MRQTILLIGLLLLAAAIGACSGSAATPAMQMGGAPADADFGATRTSDNGLFQVTYTPSLDPIAINELHEWTLHVETADGAPVNDAVISVSGGMPEHNHGMPTEPKVTASLGNGDYRVEGMQFQMGGWWTITFVIDAAGQQDSVTFNLKL